jgi:hypothetical protein
LEPRIQIISIAGEITLQHNYWADFSTHANSYQLSHESKTECSLADPKYSKWSKDQGTVD